MTDTEIKELVDAHLSLSRKERTVAYASLAPEVKLRVRKLIESRRGIAYRTEGGIPVLTQDNYITQIVRQTEKMNDLGRKEAVLKGNIAKLKDELLENWGDDALAEVEAVLADLK